MPWTSGYGHRGRVFDCSFSPSGGQILTASEDKTARVWSVCDGTIQQVACLTGHSEEVLRASWHSSEAVIATGSADQTARIWKVRPDYGSECLSVLEGHEEELYCAEWVHNHDQLFLTASGKTVALWDTAECKKLSESQLGNAVKPVHCLNVAGCLESPSMCTSAAFSTDGKKLAVSTSTNMVAVYDTATWKDGKELLYLVAGASVLCYDPVTGASSTKNSQWPSRMLLTVGLSHSTSSGATSHTYIVSSGEVVPEPCCIQPTGCPSKAKKETQTEASDPSEAPAGDSSTPNAENSIPQDQKQASEGPEAKVDDLGLFGGGQIDVTGAVGDVFGGPGRGVTAKRRGRGRRRAGADEVSRDGGKAAVNAVPDAVGRSPIELWNASDFESSVQ